MRTLNIVLWLLLSATAYADANLQSDWQHVTDKDGVSIFRRAVGNSKLYETRAVTSTWMSPTQIVNVLWDRRAYPDFIPYIKKQDILEESDDACLVYDQVKLPLVADRDYVVRVQRHVGSDGVHHIQFESADPAGPPPAKGHVRARNIRGSWRIEAPGKGQANTKITYTLYSEPGGSIPNWIVNLLQKREVPKYLRLMLRRAEQKSAKTSL